MTSTTLHRSVLMRVVGGPAMQPLFAAVAVIALVIAATGSSSLDNLVVGAVAILLWLPGATAWVRVDDVGVHRRCYLTHTYRWADIEGVGMRVQYAGVGGMRHAVAVRTGTRQHSLVPATGRSAIVRSFAADLATEAATRNIPVETFE